MLCVVMMNVLILMILKKYEDIDDETIVLLRNCADVICRCL